MKKIINALLLVTLVSSFSCEEAPPQLELLCGNNDVRVQIRQKRGAGAGIMGYPRYYHLQNYTYQGWKDIKMTTMLDDARRWCP